MPTPINRPLLWKIVHLWYIPFLLPSMFFSPFFLLYMGIKIDNKRWIQQSVVLLFAVWGCGIFGATVIESNFLVGMAIIFWLISIVVILVKSKEYLQLLDAKQRGQIEPFATFQQNKPSQTNKLNPGKKFISDLQKWQREIEVPQMRDHIQDLIDLSNVVMQKNSENGHRFFMRYSELINNLLCKYDEIENTKLNTADMKEAMYNVENNLGKIIKAFRNEVTSMYKNDILNINAETAAFIQDLKNRGLIDDDIK